MHKYILIVLMLVSVAVPAAAHDTGWILWRTIDRDHPVKSLKGRVTLIEAGLATKAACEKAAREDRVIDADIYKRESVYFGYTCLPSSINGKDYLK